MEISIYKIFPTVFINIILFFSLSFFLNLKIDAKNNFYIQRPIIGFGILIIFLNFCYIILGLPFFLIKFLVYLLSTLFFYFLFKYTSEIKDNIKKLLIFALPVCIFFFIVSQIHNKNFFIFRGNPWDIIQYIEGALIINNWGYQELISNGTEMKPLNMNYGILDRPTTFFIISFFKIYNFSNIFEAQAALKIFALIMITFSIMHLALELNVKSTYLLTFLPLTTWFFYIYEIDALAQLLSVPFLIYNFSILCKLNEDIKYFNKQISFLTVSSISLFLLYPEVSIIFLLIYFTCIIYFLKTNKFNRKFVYVILKYIFIFICFTIPFFETTYSFLIKKIFDNFSLSPKNWWGYYGSFILGRENLVLDNSYVSNLKSYLTNNDNYSVFLKILNDHYLNSYYFIPINIILSIFGFYFLGISNSFTILNFFLFFFNVFLIIYIFKIFFKNILIIFNKKKIFFFYNIKITIIFFFIIFTFLILNKDLWKLIKLFFSFGFLFLFFCTFTFSFKKKIIIKVNKIVILLLLIFPIYKYLLSQNGIGRIDSFPSSIYHKYKTDFNWSLDLNRLNKCKIIEIINYPDYYKNIPVNYNKDVIRFAFLNFILFENNFRYSINENSKNFNCRVGYDEQKYFIF